MLHFTRWKTIAIIGSVLLAIIMALPNVLPPAINAAFGAQPALRSLLL